jgi:hypothetical protein
MEWQLGLFVKVEGTVERDALEWAIRRVVREAEPARAAVFEKDGRVFQEAIDYPGAELEFYDRGRGVDFGRVARAAAG